LCFGPRQRSKKLDIFLNLPGIPKAEAATAPGPHVGDISILDLFWLILKFLAALGLVCLLLFVVYLGCGLVFRMLRSLGKFATGKASEGAIVGWVLVMVALATLACFVYKDPSFILNGFHAQPAH
jgi:hypothetical protein